MFYTAIIMSQWALQIDLIHQSHFVTSIMSQEAFIALYSVAPSLLT